MRPMAATAIIAMCVFLCAAIWYSLGRQGAARTKAKLVSVSFVGFSTNDAGRKCLRYRLRNGNARGILALAELQNGPPGLGQFVRLTNSEPQSIDLPSFPAASPYRLQVSCFVEDRGLLAHVYWGIQRIRGRPIREVSKLLFTVPGPVVEP
jgi:hypothetical protein